MKTPAAIAMLVALIGCATDESEEAFEFGQSTPQPMSGKSDEPVTCGTQSCLPELCGYDCSVRGEQATEACAATDGRPSTFVAASISGGASGSFDSRTNPYVPLLALDNVLVYGCEMWDYSNGLYDGLEIQYEELVHSSFAVNPNDPTRTKNHFGMYIGHFAGPGSYKAEGQYRSASDAAWFSTSDACSVDVSVDSAGAVNGSFTCSLKSQAGGSAAATGTFSCAKNAMSPIFSKWAAAPMR